MGGWCRVQSVSWGPLFPNKRWEQITKTPFWPLDRPGRPGVCSSVTLSPPHPVQFKRHRPSAVMPSSQLILCRPLLLLPPIPPSISETTTFLHWLRVLGRAPVGTGRAGRGGWGSAGARAPRRRGFASLCFLSRPGSVPLRSLPSSTDQFASAPRTGSLGFPSCPAIKVLKCEISGTVRISFRGSFPTFSFIYLFICTPPCAGGTDPGRVPAAGGGLEEGDEDITTLFFQVLVSSL